jgi:predicted nucleotidyltransferase
MHLTQTERDIVKAVLRHHLPAHAVWAFGSRVHGRNLKPFSDLDLAILSDHPIKPARLTGLKMAFADSDLPFQVDLVEWETLDASFRQLIMAEHEIVQARDGA